MITIWCCLFPLGKIHPDMGRHLSRHKPQSSCSPADLHKHKCTQTRIPLFFAGSWKSVMDSWKSRACTRWHLILYHPNGRVALKLHDQEAGCGSSPGHRCMWLGRVNTAAACTAGTPGAPPSVSSASSLSPAPPPCHPSVSLFPSGPRPGGSCVAGCWWARSGGGKPRGRLGNAASAEIGARCSCAPHAGSGAEGRGTGKERGLEDDRDRLMWLGCWHEMGNWSKEGDR